MMKDDLIVYRAWPADVIADALRDFNDQMHAGAGIDELSAGLHGLDFLTRRSELDDGLQARVDGAITEARMRIELLAAKEAEDRSCEERHKLLVKAVGNLNRQIISFHRRFIDPGRFDADEVREQVQQLVKRTQSMKIKPLTPGRGDPAPGEGD